MYNEVDFENKKFVKRVGKVVLDGTQELRNVNWRATDNGVGWIYTRDVAPIKLTNLNNEIPNILCTNFSSTGYNSLYAGNIGIGAGSVSLASLGIVIYQGDVSLNNEGAINRYLQANPITVYYELETPIVTDISDLLDNTFNAIECEGNGSITFKSDTEHKVPIPNSEEYLIYLNEVN